MQGYRDVAPSAPRKWTLHGAREKDLVAGALAMVIGLAALVIGRRYGIGSLVRMGPGFYPTAVGAILAVVGAIIACAAWMRPRAPGAPRGQGVNWRGVGYIGAGLLGFIAAGAHAGLVPASFVLTFVSAFSDRCVTWRKALVLAVGVSAVAAVLFGWLLRLQMPLLHWSA